MEADQVDSGQQPGPQPMREIHQPHSNDVLCGRGVTTNKWAGNEQFRSLVGMNKELYVTSTKRQKMAISRSIVEAVRSMSPPGRFLEKNTETGLWSDIGDRKATEKTSQALRDGAATLRKQLSADLGDPDFLSAVFDMDSAANNRAAEKKTDDAKSSKSKSAKKGHRRTRSNPEETLSKLKPRKAGPKRALKEPLEEEEPLSPKQARFGYNHPHSPPHALSLPASPQSYSHPGSPHSYSHPASPGTGDYPPYDAPYYEYHQGAESQPYPEYEPPAPWEHSHGPPPAPHMAEHRHHPEQYSIMSCSSFPPPPGAAPRNAHPSPRPPPPPPSRHPGYDYWGRPHPPPGHWSPSHPPPHVRRGPPPPPRHYGEYPRPDYHRRYHHSPYGHPPVHPRIRSLSPRSRPPPSPRDFTPPVSPRAADVPRSNETVITVSSEKKPVVTESKELKPKAKASGNCSPTEVTSSNFDCRDQSPSSQGIEVVLSTRDADSPLVGETIETMFETKPDDLPEIADSPQSMPKVETSTTSDTNPVDRACSPGFLGSSTPLPFGCCMDQSNLMDISDDLMRLPIAPVGHFDEGLGGLCRQ